MSKVDAGSERIRCERQNSDSALKAPLLGQSLTKITRYAIADCNWQGATAIRRIKSTGYVVVLSFRTVRHFRDKRLPMARESN